MRVASIAGTYPQLGASKDFRPGWPATNVSAIDDFRAVLPGKSPQQARAITRHSHLSKPLDI